MTSGPLDSLRAEVEAARQRLDEQLQALDAYEQAETRVRELFGDDALPGKPLTTTTPVAAGRQACALPGCEETFVRRPKSRQIFCSVACRNRANARARGPRQRRQRPSSDGAEAVAEGDPAAIPGAGGRVRLEETSHHRHRKPISRRRLKRLASAACALDLSIAAEADAPAERHDQGGGQAEVPAGAGQVFDAGVIATLADDLAIRSAGEEERPAFGGCGEHDLAIDHLAGCAREGDAAGVLACSGPRECLIGSGLGAAPLDHALHGEDGHSGCALDNGLIVAVDEGAVAEVDEAADQGAVVAVAVDASGEAHGDLQDDVAGQAADASPADPASHQRPDVPRGPAQRKAGCARCGEPIDRATRRNSGYCSDECREEAREVSLRERKAGDAWQFALHPLLYGRLGGCVEDVRLFPHDRVRLEQRPHAGA
jgi:hypothetical protein